ncbi:hypothetical protein ACQEVI_00850 [Promicromonospora sp. CA-289599]|uniref:hypothetical protein n=1 Tax=Promicromonospora sp. CA-289599 TaxID=3240014 RepID=UPI003D91AA6C
MRIIRPVAAAIAVLCSAFLLAAPMGAAQAQPATETLTIDEVLAKEAAAGEIGTQAQTFYYCAVLDGTTGCKSGYPVGSGLVVARLYQYSNFNVTRHGVEGFQIVIYNPRYSVGCTSGTGDNEGRFTISAANRNKINSVKTYHGCDVKLYNGTNFTGSSTPFIDQAANLNVYGFNNSAESVKIS